MNSINKITQLDMKVKLSTLWIFAMLNYLYADVFGLTDPVILKQILSGTAGSMQITQGFLLSFAILMEIPIAMVLLSRLLDYRSNRVANIIAGIIKTVVVFLSMFVQKPTIYYLFFGIIEMATTSIIVWYAWNWNKPTNEALQEV
jgi:hypothetical protein